MTGKTQMPNVAIVGRPNVGKSALFNRLLGRKIAIVHNQPGITRDRISGICSRAGQPFLLWDTGGIDGESELTAHVRRAVEGAIVESDLLLFLVDAQQGLSPIDQELGRILRRSGKPILLVINKIDHPKHENLAADFASLGFHNSISVSAAHGRGMADLIQLIDRHLSFPIEVRSSAPDLQPPLALAVVGRPNVGKSSFINSIVQSERAIVSELPGTTRDAVDISYRRDGRQFVFIDTAGIRRRSKHSTSVEVFSVMRAERSIRRADLSVLLIDVTSGVTAQDKRIAGLIQKARKAAIVVTNKFDLVKPKRGVSTSIDEIVALTREQLFFLEYAPVLVASAKTRENVERLFLLTAKVQRAAEVRIGTGVLNRVLRAAFSANPPPMIAGRRLKLFYAAQASGIEGRPLQPPEFVLFVNEPRLLNETYRRYLEARIRDAEPYIGLSIILTCRARSASRQSGRQRRPGRARQRAARAHFSRAVV